MSLQTTIAALLLVAWCPLRAAADVSELLSAPPPDAFTSDFRQAGDQLPLPPPQGRPDNARFLQNDGATRGFLSQAVGDQASTRRVFFRLGDSPPLSDHQGFTARAGNCRDTGSCPDQLQVRSFPNPNNFLRGFPTPAPSDPVPRVQNGANFPSPPQFSRSLPNSPSPLQLTSLQFQNQAPPQIPMQPRRNGSPGTASVRTSGPLFFNNAPPMQMASRSDVPPFPNNAPATQLVSRSESPRLSFSNSIPQPIFRSDTSRVSLPDRVPETQVSPLSDIPPLSFPNNAPPARASFRPNAAPLPLSNGALPTQLFPRSEAPRPSLSNNAPLSQLVSSSGDARFAPSNSAGLSQFVPRPEAFPSPQRIPIPNSALCTPENPCSFPDISNEIPGENKIPANYQFSYAVQDPASASDFAHEESAQAEGIKGQYRVLLPDGRQQVVSYRADESGFRPDISYQ